MNFQFIGNLVLGTVVVLACVAIFVIVELHAQELDRERRRRRAELQREGLKAARVRTGLDISI